MYDESKVDEMVLALLHLNAFEDKFGWRAWKGFDRDAMNRQLSHQEAVLPSSGLRTEEATSVAVDRYNELVEEDRPVGALIHSTC